MQNEIMDMFNQYNESVMNTAKRMGELNVRTFEALASKQAAIVSDCFESSTKQVEVLSSAKDYKEVLAAQAAVVKGCNEKFLNNVKETTDMLASVRDELTKLVEEAVKQNAENVEKASELAKKTAA